MEQRQKGAYQKFLYNFIRGEVLVHCPKCCKKATVVLGATEFPDVKEDEIKVVCSSCSFFKSLTDKEKPILLRTNRQVVRGRMYFLNAPRDPFFRLPVWMMTRYKNHLLWAYNHEHLEYLRTFVEAKLRERNGEENVYNKSFGSRMPKWMQSKKNRDSILKKLEELRIK